MANTNATTKPGLTVRLMKYNKFYVAALGFAANGILATMHTDSVYYPIVSAVAAALVVAVPNKKANSQ